MYRVKENKAPNLERQIRLSRMLSMGFVFTISPAWLFSCVSIFIGVRAMIIISESTEPMAGRVMAWWCIIVGSLENSIALFYLLHHYLKFM
jgi:hypothetical protein